MSTASAPTSAAHLTSESAARPAPHVLVRWTGRDASGDTREPLEHLTNCEEARPGPARPSLNDTLYYSTAGARRNPQGRPRRPRPTA